MYIYIYIYIFIYIIKRGPSNKSSGSVLQNMNYNFNPITIFHMNIGIIQYNVNLHKNICISCTRFCICI